MHGPAVLPGEHPVRVLVVVLEEGSLGPLLRPPLGEDIRCGAVDGEQPKGVAGLAVDVLSLTIDDNSGRRVHGHSVWHGGRLPTNAIRTARGGDMSRLRCSGAWRPRSARPRRCRL